MPIDPVELSRELVAFNTINPPGRELACIKHLEKILAASGLATSVHGFGEDRANLIAALLHRPCRYRSARQCSLEFRSVRWRRCRWQALWPGHK
jgi:succinyl-diaminopimelate desuccinylase